MPTNKFVILLLALIVLLAGGIGYRKFLLPESAKPVNTGVVREITVRIPKNTWSFNPDSIDIDRGDTLAMTFVNEDDYDHGLGIDAYGISQRIPARSTVAITPFVVTKGGDFQFYCSVSCSEGVAESGAHKGEHRGHFDQIGVLHVKEFGASSEGTENASSSVPTIPALHIPTAIIGAERSLAKELHIPLDMVKVAYMGSKVWADSCLELPRGAASDTCVKTKTPGYEVVLRANGQDYAFRIDEHLLIRAIPKELLSPR